MFSSNFAGGQGRRVKDCGVSLIREPQFLRKSHESTLSTLETTSWKPRRAPRHKQSRLGPAHLASDSNIHKATTREKVGSSPCKGRTVVRTAEAQQRKRPSLIRERLTAGTKAPSATKTSCWRDSEGRLVVLL
jgi:hypothetical protein